MKATVSVLAATLLLAAVPAQAHDTTTPHATRGDCEKAMAEINIADREWLYATFPQLFDSRGKVMKHLTSDFQCEYNGADGNWYIVDHRFG